MTGRAERREQQRRRRATDLETAWEAVNNASAALSMIEIQGSPHRAPHLRLRPGFFRHERPIPGEWSDQHPPPAELRPPATRLLTPRGLALRFYLIALFEAQANAHPGTHPTNRRAIRHRDGYYDRSWADLVAPPVKFNPGKPHATAQGKRVRAIHSALKSLKQVGMVSLPKLQSSRGKYEEFELLDDRGKPSDAEAQAYTVPTEDYHEVPSELFTNGWIHLLEDSEIALLLILSTADADHRFRMPAETRLTSYGLPRDSYTAAHKFLEKLGLISVIPINRHPDGKVVNYKRDRDVIPHRFEWYPEQLGRSALQVFEQALRRR